MNRSIAALVVSSLASIAGLPLQAATPPPTRPVTRPPSTTVVPRPKPSQPIAAQQAGNLSFYTKPQTGVQVFQARFNATAAPLNAKTTDITTSLVKPAPATPVVRPTVVLPTTDLR